MEATQARSGLQLRNERPDCNLGRATTSGGGIVIGENPTADVPLTATRASSSPPEASSSAIRAPPEPNSSACTKASSYQTRHGVGDIDGECKLDIVIAGTKPNGQAWSTATIPLPPAPSSAHSVGRNSARQPLTAARPPSALPGRPLHHVPVAVSLVFLG